MPTVKFPDDDIDVEVEMGASLRDTAQTEGSTIPFGCEQGICGTCLIDIADGEDSLSEMEENEKETLYAMGAEPEQRLACQCRVEGDVTVKSAQ